MNDELTNRVVVVAGASAGLGFAVARECAKQKARVMMFARNADRLVQAASDIGNLATPIACDITNPDSVRSAFDQIAEEAGHIDVLVNVAAIARIRLLSDASDEDIESIVRTNLFGPIYCIRSAVPLMRSTSNPQIINVSSEISLGYMPGMTLYSCSKAGLDDLSRCLVNELAPEGIRICNFVSGKILGTDFVSNFELNELEHARRGWLESGYSHYVAGDGVEVEAMAGAMMSVIMSSPEVLFDVYHARSSGRSQLTRNGDAT